MSRAGRRGKRDRTIVKEPPVGICVNTKATTTRSRRAALHIKQRDEGTEDGLVEDTGKDTVDDTDDGTEEDTDEGTVDDRVQLVSTLSDASKRRVHMVAQGRGHGKGRAVGNL